MADDTEVFDALEKEAKEFDKVSKLTIPKTEFEV